MTIHKANKNVGKKAKSAIESEQIKAKLLEKYIEGESNIDYRSLEPDDVWQLINTEGLPIDEKEKKIGRPIPLLTQKEWLEKELAKLDAVKPKEPPSFKVQNPYDVESKYHQKFMEKIIEFNPQIFENLRELTPHFEVLFANKAGKHYLDILRDLIGKLLWHRHIYPMPENQMIEDESYIWGDLQYALTAARIYYFATHQNYKLNKVIKDVIEDNKYKLQLIEKEIKTVLKETAKDEDSILPNFYSLQGNIYEWVEKYNLRKDWLVDYAYYFIDQFSQNRSILVSEIAVPKRSYSYDTLSYDFEFKTRGWWASEEGESALEYKTRVTEEFEKQLNSYLSETTSRLGLDKLKKVTKSPTYENVEWLAYSLVRDCDAERIVEKFYPDISANKTKSKLANKAFISKKKHIENEIRKLKFNGLPENKKI